MKAVILAAGHGKRMRPLSADTPKPLLPVAGKPIIQHSFESLEDVVEEFIIVTGFKGEKLREKIGREDVKFVEQQEPLGTADAALKAREHIDGKTLILNGDDIYRVNEERILEAERGLGVAEVENPGKYGVVETREGLVTGIEEKPDRPSSNQVNTGLYLVKEEFFGLLEKVEESERGEYEITDAVSDYIDEHQVEEIGLRDWIPCSYPWQLLEASSSLMDDLDHRIDGKVDPTVQISGDVVVEDGAEIKAFSVVEGPAVIKSGAEIGPHAYLRPGTVVHGDVRVGRSEVKNSVICESSRVPHFSYVGDSYLGEDVNLGAGVKVANLRNDGEQVKVEVKGEMMETGRRKLGAFIGSGAKIGCETVIKPGRKIGSEASTDAQEKVSRNLPPGKTLKDGEIR